ncbi:hypothetical protein G6F59_014243 [Rhizopus arrhizus]|nr:hypothetical protein G6F59_014243 [Rhizopus arrhizus]
MQDLQLGQPGRLVAVVAWIAEARGQVHVAQQLHTVEAGLFEEPDRALALADDQQLAEPSAADAVAVDGIEAQGPALVAARRWRNGVLDPADLGGDPGGLQPGHPHLPLEQGKYRQSGAGPLGVQHVDGVVHVAAHVHVPGNDVARQQRDGRAGGHHELVRLAGGDLVEQWGVEENVAGQQVERVDAQQDIARDAPSAKTVRAARGSRGQVLLCRPEFRQLLRNRWRRYVTPPRPGGWFLLVSAWATTPIREESHGNPSCHRR